MRPSGLGWALNIRTSVLIRDRRKEYRDKGYWYWGYVVTGQGHQEQRRIPPWSLWRKCGLTDTLTSDCWSPKL